MTCLLLLITSFLNFSSLGFSSQGSPQRIFHLRSVLSVLHPPPSLPPWPCPLSLHPFRLSQFPFSWQFHLTILLPIYQSSYSFLRTCLNHLSLASHVFSPNRPTRAVPLMYSFLILSILVTPIPNDNRNIFNVISEQSSLFSPAGWVRRHITSLPLHTVHYFFCHNLPSSGRSCRDLA